MELLLEIEEDGKRRSVPLRDPEVTIGRGTDNTVVIGDPRSSRRHCCLRQTPQGLVLEDLQSRNGTLLNGASVSRSFVKAGDSFEVGKVRFLVREPGSTDMRTLPGLEPAGAVAGRLAAATAVAAPEPQRPALPFAATLTAESRPAVAVAERVALEGKEGVHAGERIAVRRSPFVIGRKEGCDFRCRDKRASGRHAQIVRDGDHFCVEDLGSTNGTILNTRPVKRAVLTPGALIQIGDCTFRVDVPPLTQGAARKAAEEAAVEEAGIALPGEGEALHFDVERFLAARRSEQPLAVAAVIILLGIFCYFVVDVARRVFLRPEIDPLAEGNFLGEHWSFERANEPGVAAVPGWRLGEGQPGRLEATALQAQHPGLKALRLTASGGQGLCLASCEREVTVEPGRRYRLEGFVANRGTFAAGLLITWLQVGSTRTFELGKLYSDTARSAGEAVDVDQTFAAPAATTSARISCFVLDGGEAVFDRLSFRTAENQPRKPAVEGEAPGTDAKGPPAPDAAGGADATDIVLRAGREGNPLLVTLRPDGTFTVAGRRRQALSAVWVGLPPERDPLLLGPRLSQLRRGTPDAGGLLFVSEVPDAEEKRWVTVETTASAPGEEANIRWRGSLAAEGKAGPTGGGADLCLYLETRLDLLPVVAHGGEKPVRFILGEKSRAAEGSKKPVEGDTPPAVELKGTGITEVVLGAQDERVALMFRTPVDLGVFAQASDPSRLMLIVRGAKEGVIELALGSASRQEGEEARLVARGAEEAYRSGRAGEAMETLAKLKEQFPEEEAEADRARARLEEWKEIAADELRGLEHELGELRALPTLAVYESLLARANALAERYRGAAQEKTALKVGADLKAFWDDLKGRHSREQVEAYHEKAKVHRAGGQPALAELYYGWVIEVAPESEAAKEARQALERLKKRRTENDPRP